MFDHIASQGLTGVTIYQAFCLDVAQECKEFMDVESCRVQFLL